MNTNALSFIFLQVIFLVLRNNFELMMGLLGHRRQPNLQLSGDGTEVDDENFLLSSLLALVCDTELLADRGLLGGGYKSPDECIRRLKMRI